MASTMFAEVECSIFCFLNGAQLFLFTLRVRASYSRVCTFEATFHAQREPRILIALTMLAEVEFSIVCFK